MTTFKEEPDGQVRAEERRLIQPDKWRLRERQAMNYPVQNGAPTVDKATSRGMLLFLAK